MQENNLSKVTHKIASIAASLERKVLYFISLALLSCIFIAWQWLDFDQFNMLFIGKVLLLSMPILCWFLFWLLLKQLTGLPEQVSELKNLGTNSVNMIAEIQQGTASKKNIFSRVYQLVTNLREPEILETLLLCSKGIGLIINPLALLILLVSATFILMFILLACVMLIF